ncbi:MAG: hypothetical protein JNK05_25325 [Myxococcales bacterium]|nr:hypothetical protein [Myxococcales bacterium]
MTLQSILARTQVSDDALVAALSERDPLRVAAASALAERVSASDSGIDAWKALFAKDARAALVVARFIARSPEAVLSVLVEALEDERTRLDAIRAIYLHTRRPGLLGVHRRAVVRAQRFEGGGVDDYAAFAIARALENGEDFEDSIDALIETFTVRWEGARALGRLADRGVDLSAFAPRVLDTLWLGDDRAKTAEKIIKQAVAKGISIDLAPLHAMFEKKDVQSLGRALRCAGGAASLGVDVGPLLPALDRLARDKRQSVVRDVEGAVRESLVAWSSERYRKLLAAHPALNKLVKSAVSERKPTPFGAAVAKGDGEALRALVAKDPHEHIGPLHFSAGRAIGAPLVAAATVDAVAHEDKVVRFAAIDAIAIGAGAPCDLRPHVPALVDALKDKTRPELARGSGGWQTNGISYSATQALAFALRWDTTATTMDALVAAMNARAALTASNAAFALAKGLAMAGRLAELAPHLSHKRPEVRVELLRAIVAVDVPVPSALAVAIVAMRNDDDRSVAQAASWVAIEGDALDDARARACRIVDKSFRFREVQRLLSATIDDERALALLASALVEILDDPNDRAIAARALVRLAEQGASVVDQVQPMLDAIRERRDAIAPLIARALRVAVRQGAKIPPLTETQSLALSEANAVDLVGASAEPWTDERVALLLAQMRVNDAEAHPAYFTEQCERSAVAARLLSTAARAGVAIPEPKS